MIHPKMMTINDVVRLLIENDDILILSHHFPDGDTLGSAYALCGALQILGKRARVECADEIPNKFLFIKNSVEIQHFEPKYIVSADVADSKLLCSLCEVYGNKIDLCIDHHSRNTSFAKQSYVEGDSAACAEIIYLIVKELINDIPKSIADCLYTGISTDTGCFKFSNVTARTHRIAAELISLGCEHALINKVMFDTKSRSRIALEKAVLDNLKFEYNGLCATVALTRDMIASSGAAEDDIDGISSLPRQIEGVAAAVTMRELESGAYKVSLRTDNALNAAQIAVGFGGGGHAAAAGCTIKDTRENAEKMLIEAVGAALKKQNMI